MDRAEFRQWAMIYAMQGLLASGLHQQREHIAFKQDELAKWAIVYAGALLEANTIDEVPKSETP